MPDPVTDCPHCGAPVPDGMLICPTCHTPLDVPAPEPAPTGPGVVAPIADGPVTVASTDPPPTEETPATVPLAEEPPPEAPAPEGARSTPEPPIPLPSAPSRTATRRPATPPANPFAAELSRRLARVAQWAVGGGRPGDRADRAEADHRRVRGVAETDPRPPHAARSLRGRQPARTRPDRRYVARGADGRHRPGARDLPAGRPRRVPEGTTSRPGARRARARRGLDARHAGARRRAPAGPRDRRGGTRERAPRGEARAAEATDPHAPPPGGEPAEGRVTAVHFGVRRLSARRAGARDRHGARSDRARARSAGVLPRSPRRGVAPIARAPADPRIAARSDGAFDDATLEQPLEQTDVLAPLVLVEDAALGEAEVLEQGGVGRQPRETVRPHLRGVGMAGPLDTGVDERRADPLATRGGVDREADETAVPVLDLATDDAE